MLILNAVDTAWCIYFYYLNTLYVDIKQQYIPLEVLLLNHLNTLYVDIKLNSNIKIFSNFPFKYIIC